MRRQAGKSAATACRSRKSPPTRRRPVVLATEVRRDRRSPPSARGVLTDFRQRHARTRKSRVKTSGMDLAFARAILKGGLMASSRFVVRAVLGALVVVSFALHASAQP